jgi:hypothetical protein
MTQDESDQISQSRRFLNPFMERAFTLEERDLIEKAANHVKSHILDVYSQKNRKAPKMSVEFLDSERENLMGEINEIVKFVLDFDNQGKEISFSYGLHAADVLMSVLTFYYDSLYDDYEISNIEAMGDRIDKIKDIMDMPFLDAASRDLYNVYRDKEESAKEGLIFISYSTKDKKLARIIYNKMSLKYNLFLAHDDIKISDEWRSIILDNLKKCDYLVTIVTENFLKSCWTNQEVGFALARNIPIASIFFTSEKKAGFLESKQGIVVEEVPDFDIITKHLFDFLS